MSIIFILIAVAAGLFVLISAGILVMTAILAHRHGGNVGRRRRAGTRGVGAI